MARSRIISLSTAFGVTALVVVLAYLASTWGLVALSGSAAPRDTGAGTLPSVVENAPASLGTTEQHGPLGDVSLVYAGTDVEAGLLGEVEHPWLAVAARTGEYRAISAPDLPSARAGAVALSQGGDRMAWATGDGVELYDTGTDRAESIPIEGATEVGAFSPDGTMLTVHAGGLSVVDLGNGEVLATADGTDPEVVRRAAWRADGSAVDYGRGTDLVSLPTDGGEQTTRPSPFAEESPLAWAPSGRQLVALEDLRGVRALRSVEVDGNGSGELGTARRVDTSGISLQGLLGFSGDGSVAVRALLLESGDLERILDVQLDGGSPIDMTTLPAPGENWRGSGTLAASGDALRGGSADFGAHVWPWSYRARLAACVLVGLFGLGLWLTRRRGSLRRSR